MHHRNRPSEIAGCSLSEAVGCSQFAGSFAIDQEKHFGSLMRLGLAVPLQVENDSMGVSAMGAY